VRYVNTFESRRTTERERERERESLFQDLESVCGRF